MLIDVNGMEFHLTITPKVIGGPLNIRIIDESFRKLPISARANDTEQVVALLETYVGQRIPENTYTVINQHVTKTMQHLKQPHFYGTYKTKSEIKGNSTTHLRVVSSFGVNLASTRSRSPVSVP